MNILHVIPSYPPATAYTGPPAALHRLCKELRILGIDVRVATTNADGDRVLDVPPGEWTDLDGVPVFYGNRLGNRGDLSWSLWRCMRDEAPRSDIVHMTAVYSWPTLVAGTLCQRTGVPLVLSPRGSLAPAALAWRSSRKRVFSLLGGRRALRSVSAFHASTDREAEDIKRLFPSSTVGIIPNGVDIPEEMDLSRWRVSSSERTVLYLGRLHPHKNVEMMIRAWAQVGGGAEACALVMAGPGDARTVEDLRRLSEDLGIGGRTRFEGMVQGEEKHRLLAAAAVLVLPSKSENFGNAVAEALAHGTPVLASRGTPWKDLESRGCGWWVEAREDRLAAAIEAALAKKPEDLMAMGQKGREWMRREYSWASVAARMKEFYGEILERARSAQ